MLRAITAASHCIALHDPRHVRVSTEAPSYDNDNDKDSNPVPFDATKMERAAPCTVSAMLDDTGMRVDVVMY